MWYVIQTKTGFEHEMVDLVESLMDTEAYHGCVIPVYEEVRRSGGASRIRYKKLFPGYVLVEIDDPEEIVPVLRRIPDFARLLGSEDGDGGKTFIPISGDDMDFLYSILEDGVLKVSYVEQVKGTVIKRIIGPLAKYGNHITRVDFRCRRAIVEAEIFDKRRRIRFGLWTDEDPRIPWIEEALKQDNEPDYLIEESDIGIHPGDKVRDLTEIYGEETFIVEKVNPVKRTVVTSVRMFNSEVKIELFVDQVEKQI